MRKFLAQLSISILGTLLALVLIVGLVLASFSGKRNNRIENNSILKLSFSGDLPEQTGNISVQGFSTSIASGPGIFE
jgi:hypothetical protein